MEVPIPTTLLLDYSICDQRLPIYSQTEQRLLAYGRAELKMLEVTEREPRHAKTNQDWEKEKSYT
jgi:hypothetical protein